MCLNHKNKIYKYNTISHWFATVGGLNGDDRTGGRKTLMGIITDGKRSERR